MPWDHDPSFAVIGACIDVHREWGPGFLESAYARAVEMELQDRGIPYQRELRLPLWYRDRPTGLTFIADLFVEPGMLLELKALPHIGQRERFQLTHYLKAARIPVGLLVNFGQERLQVQRVTWPRASFPTSQPSALPGPPTPRHADSPALP